jgi:hypothetical protein
MSKFLVTYHGPGMPHDPESVARAKEAFGKWLNEAGKAVVDPGAPVNMVKQVSSGTPTPPSSVDGYSIVEADSEEQVLKLLRTHPFVTRGGTLQVNKCL